MYSTSLGPPEDPPGERPAPLAIAIREHVPRQGAPPPAPGGRSLFARAVAAGAGRDGRPFALARPGPAEAPARPPVAHPPAPAPGADPGGPLLGYGGGTDPESVPFCSAADIGLLCRSTNPAQREYGLRMLGNAFALRRTRADGAPDPVLEALLRFPADPHDCPSSAGHLLLLALRDALEAGSLGLLDAALSALATVFVADEGFLSEAVHVGAALLGLTSSSVAFHAGPLLRRLVGHGLLELLDRALDAAERADERRRERLVHSAYLLAERVLIGCAPACEAPDVAAGLRALAARLLGALLGELRGLLESGAFLTTVSRVALRTLCYDHVLEGHALGRAEAALLAESLGRLVEALPGQAEALRPELLSAATLHYLLVSRVLRGSADLLPLHAAVSARCAAALQRHAPSAPAELNNLLVLLQLLRARAAVPGGRLGLSAEGFRAMVDWRRPPEAGGFALPQRPSAAYAPFYALAALQWRGAGEWGAAEDWVPCLMDVLASGPPLTRWSPAAVEAHRRAGALLCSVTDAGAALALLAAALAAVWGPALPFARSIAERVAERLAGLPAEFRFVVAFPLARLLPPRPAIEHGLYPNAALLEALRAVTGHAGYDPQAEALAHVDARGSLPALEALHAACCLASDGMRRDGAWRQAVLRLALEHLGRLGDTGAARDRVLAHALLCVLDALTGVCSLPAELASVLAETLAGTVRLAARGDLCPAAELLYAAPAGGLRTLDAAAGAFAAGLAEGGAALPEAPLVYLALLHPRLDPDPRRRAALWAGLALLRLDFSGLDADLLDLCEDDPAPVLACLACYERRAETLLARRVLGRYAAAHRGSRPEQVVVAAVEGALGAQASQ